MAYEALISYIQSIVRPNFNEEISGQNMQEVLLSMVQTLGVRELRGVASINTNPGTPTGQAVYIASQPGTYQYFNNLEVENEICLFIWNNGAWEKQTIIPLGHFCYIAWRNAPGEGFTLEPNLDRQYEAILITHNPIATPVESNFAGLWRYRAVNGDVAIPTLKLSTGHFRAAGDTVRRRDDLYATWDAADEAFLNYNPEIWVFRRRNNARRKLVSEDLGEELCTDPGCDNPAAWTLNDRITVEDSAIKFQNVDDGESIYMPLLSYQAWPWSWYEFTFTVRNYLAGIIRAFYGDAFSEGITANGTYTIRIRRKAHPIAFGFIAAASSTSLDIDNVSFKRVIRHFDISYKKKWCHEPHLNGIKYPNSNFWAGETTCEIASIQESGRQTEFELTAVKQEKQLIGIDPYEYIYGKEIATDEFIKLSDSTIASELSNFKAAGTSNLSIAFRLAIVIDHPAVPGAKLIGNLSDPVYLRLHKVNDAWGVLESFIVRYKSSQIILRNT